MDKQVLDLEKEIKETRKYTHTINDGFINRIYDLKRKHLGDQTNYAVLQNMEEYVHYQNKKLDSFKNTLLSLINVVFIPLGFLVGYFGMNFSSMGNPDIANGVLSTPNAEWYLAMFAIVAFVVIVLMYSYLFGVHIPL